MNDCLFCKIVAGDIPSSKVYEDEDVLAFLDISQATKGHTLVIPKEHVRNALEMTQTQAANLFARIPKIARALQKASLIITKKPPVKPSFMPMCIWFLALLILMNLTFVLSNTNLTLPVLDN